MHNIIIFITIIIKFKNKKINLIKKSKGWRLILNKYKINNIQTHEQVVMKKYS